jgi:hypothetical protein
MTIRIVAALAAWGLLVTGARAESLTEDNVESRFVLAFQADAGALQKRLPPDLEVAPAPAGPVQGANLFVVLYDRFLQQDPAGKTTATATLRFGVIVAAVKSRATGKPAFAVLRGFSPSSELVPGYYKVNVSAEVEHEIASAAKALEPGRAKEAWKVKAASGDAFRIRVEYARGVPARAQREMLIFSTAQEGLYRTYRTDEVTDLIRSVPAKIDRAKKLEYSFAIRDMADLFGRETRLVAAMANPVHLRKVFVPEQTAQR